MVRARLSYTTATAAVFFLWLPSRLQHVLERFLVGSKLAICCPLDKRLSQPEEAPRLSLDNRRQARSPRYLLTGKGPPLIRERAARGTVRKLAVGFDGGYLEGRLKSATQKLGHGRERVP